MYAPEDTLTRTGAPPIFVALVDSLGVRQILFWEGDYIDARANKESLQAWMRAHAQALAPAGRP